MELKTLATKWNSALSNGFDYDNWNLFVKIWLTSDNKLPTPSATVKLDTATGVYRLYDSANNQWLVNSAGYYLYYKPETGGVSGGDTPAQEKGTWLPQNQVDLKVVHLVNAETLQDYADHYGGTVATFSEYLFCRKMENGRSLLLVDSQNRPYAVIRQSSSTASGTPNNYYTQVDTTINNNEGDKTEIGPTYNDNSTVFNGGDTINNNIVNVEDNSVWFPVDITDNSVWYPNSSWQFIDNLYYDDSTHTYYVDSHDSYVWSNQANTYITNHYSYEIQYHIDYTSITYIGQTAEYDEEYKFYYELPDGRSSADLTAADLEQLSLAFRDVVNYVRTADDVSQRVLYHFDGDTQDSSYWSYCTSFRWDKGASLTYMDEGTFNGSLYLDETEHDFTITLPNNDVSGDFTLQFRYYQSHTEAPKLDSYISLSGTKILQMDGAKYYTGSGSAIASTSIGAWNELCLMRKNGVLYYYINGVPYTSVSNTAYGGNTIRFYFGASQQTYKKLDEMRFTKRAIYTPGQGYQPTAVPYDTNLALVLPDGEVPVADEFFTITPGANNLLTAAGLDDWSDYQSVSASGRLSAFSLASLGRFWNTGLLYGSGVSFSNSDNGVKASFAGSPSFDGSGDYRLHNSLYFGIKVSANGEYIFPFGNAQGSYCLSVLLSDGSYSYVVFTTRGSAVSTEPAVSQTLHNSNVYFNYLNFYDGSYTYWGFQIYPTTGSTLDIVYMELVQGTKPSFKLEWQNSVYSSGQLQDSPVLAVRSNLDVSSYQIGGVRPSYPQRAQVWALVEDSRITSLQQYNGSAWVAVDGRIWTGSRWIPYSSFDVFTLKDLWDAVGGSTDSDYTYIYTESGFWDWWQKSWRSWTGSFDEWMAKLLAAVGGGGSGPGSGEDPVLPDNPLVSSEPLKQDDYIGVVKLLRDIYGFFSGFFDDFTVGGIENFLVFLTDENSEIYGIFNGAGWGLSP